MAMARSRACLLQAIIGYVVLTDFVLYRIHRAFHLGFVRKYHAVHHASKDLEDWRGAHPLNLAGTAAVDGCCWLASLPIFFCMSRHSRSSPPAWCTPTRTDIRIPRQICAGQSGVLHRWHHGASKYRTQISPAHSRLGPDIRDHYLPAGKMPSSAVSIMTRDAGRFFGSRWLIRSHKARGRGHASGQRGLIRQ